MAKRMLVGFAMLVAGCGASAGGAALDDVAPRLPVGGAPAVARSAGATGHEQVVGSSASAAGQASASAVAAGGSAEVQGGGSGGVAPGAGGAGQGVSGNSASVAGTGGIVSASGGDGVAGFGGGGTAPTADDGGSADTEAGGSGGQGGSTSGTGGLAGGSSGQAGASGIPPLGYSECVDHNFMDCNGVAGDGHFPDYPDNCEASKVSKDHCGSCNVKCAEGTVCSMQITPDDYIFACVQPNP